MRTVPPLGVRGWARRSGFVVVAALCVTGMLATAVSATSVAAKKPKPKGSSSSIKNIASALQKEEKATFSATYTLKTSSVNGTFTYAQKPPDFVLSFATAAGKFEFIELGTKSWGCSAAAGATVCVPETKSVASTDLDFFQPGKVLPEIESYESGAKGYTSFTKTFAGQASKCVTVDLTSTKPTYCVTNGGVFAYSSEGTLEQITLTGFSGSPPSSLFALPAGAKITSAP
jgi:hypothetical protein